MEVKLGPRQRIDLIARLARQLQATYTFPRLKALLKQYGAYVGEPQINSKAIYVEDQLEQANDALVLRIAEDFGLVQPTIEPDSQAARRLWREDGFRLFVSHISKYKKGANELAKELKRFGVASFVAHDSIESGREWQAQIELALQTMDALVVVVTEDIEKSSWCDQEVGWALGSNKLVIPLKVDLDPYGFIGRYQAINGYQREKSELAFEIACILAANEKSRPKAVAVAHSLAFAAARDSDSDRFWMAISAVIDNGQVDSEVMLKPLVARIDEKVMSRAGISDAFADYLREKGHDAFAKIVEEADAIPF